MSCNFPMTTIQYPRCSQQCDRHNIIGQLRAKEKGWQCDNDSLCTFFKMLFLFAPNLFWKKLKKIEDPFCDVTDSRFLSVWIQCRCDIWNGSHNKCRSSCFCGCVWEVGLVTATFTSSKKKKRIKTLRHFQRGLDRQEGSAVSIFTTCSFHHCALIAHSDLWIKINIIRAKLQVPECTCVRPSVRAQQSSRNMEVLLHWRRNGAGRRMSPCWAGFHTSRSESW